VIEGRAKNEVGQDLGDFDAVIAGRAGPVIAEWETGNISSSHRSMNKITMLVSDGVVAAGVLVIPSRKLYEFLTDRIGNYRELEPYLKLWKSVPCKSGVVEIVVIEQDAESMKVSPIPKTAAGRSKKAR
jgi:Restriction endonuclease BamHI